MIEILRKAAGPNARLGFDAFMELALYHPQKGYYSTQRQRVGRDRDSDFFTASSLGNLFGELVIAAVVKRLKDAGADPAELHFVELGAEKDGGILKDLSHPFASATCRHLGDSLELCGPTIAFSNELFDAQPCRRFLRSAGAWIELGVQIEATDQLNEVELDVANEVWLPPEAQEGYRFDAPVAAASLAERLANQKWQGLFIAFDYGKSLWALATECPAGTLRAYHQHSLEKNLLARPGEQDLTCHICWDWISAALSKRGFNPTRLESQEAFFVHHAAESLSAIMAAEAARPSHRTMALLQLLHPGNMGQKFQVLHAWRD